MAPFFDMLRKAGQVVLATAPFVKEHVPSPLPDLNVTITPKYLDSSQISSLDIQMVIARPTIPQGHGLVSMALQFGNVPSCRYDGDALSASDEKGSLSLTKHDEPDEGGTKVGDIIRTWRTTRNTVGHVKLSFEAFPREVNTSTPPGPRLELAKDQGGLMGSGASFLPLPINEDLTYSINLAWNLEAAPPGSSAVWAFGEGNTSRVGPAADLEAFYAIGPVKKYSRPEKDFGTYWFGDTPFDSIALAKNAERMLSEMLDFFHDPEPTFRVFIRKSIYRSYGGTGSPKSFLLEYDSVFSPTDNLDEITGLLAHEFVHEWPLMSSGNDISRGIEASPAWYNEGIADFYEGLLPYRFGMFNRRQLLSELNTIASSYYTSPAIGMDDHRATKLALEDTHAQRIPYSRGAMFLFKLDAELRNASGGKRSLYQPMLRLLELKYARKPYGLEQWLPLIEAELGEESTSDFKAMLAGEVVIPAADCLELEGLKLVRWDQERYELGFDQASFATHVITGLVPDSRAAAAGLRDGDILETWRTIWSTADGFLENQVVTVVRGDELVELEYWPRTWEKVESYQWVVDEEDDDEL